MLSLMMDAQNSLERKKERKAIPIGGGAAEERANE